MKYVKHTGKQMGIFSWKVQHLTFTSTNYDYIYTDIYIYIFKSQTLTLVECK